MHLFGFIAGYTKYKVIAEDPINIKAAELMGKLHDELKNKTDAANNYVTFSSLLCDFICLLIKPNQKISEKDIEDAIDKGEVKSLIRHLENVIVQKALIKTHGNITQAAILVNMNRGTVRNILKRAEG